MADLILPTTFTISGGYTLAPALPVPGGVEAAVELDEIVQLVSVSGPSSRLIAANTTESLDIATLLGTGNNGGVLVVQASAPVEIEVADVLLARGLFFALILDANLLSGSLSLTNLSATQACSVRFCIGSRK